MIMAQTYPDGRRWAGERVRWLQAAVAAHPEMFSKLLGAMATHPPLYDSFLGTVAAHPAAGTNTAGKYHSSSWV